MLLENNILFSCSQAGYHVVNCFCMNMNFMSSIYDRNIVILLPVLAILIMHIKNSYILYINFASLWIQIAT